MKTDRILGFAAMAAMLLASCSEEQTGFNIGNVPGKATISGDIVYNAGTSLRDGKFVYDIKAAADVEVFVTVDNSGYDSKLEGKSTFSTRTDENGHYSIEVPTGSNSVYATVRTADFAGTMTTVERRNNSIVTVENPVVRWAEQSLSLSDHGIYYGNMTCSHRDPQVLPETYATYAQIQGLYNRNVEKMTPIEAVRDPETNELIGYRDAELDYEWEGFGAVDLIVAVVYRNGGASATYNCTTDATGKYVLNVPVPAFPVEFDINVQAMPKNGTFTTYEATTVTRVVNEVEREYRSYIPHQLNGYYAMSAMSGEDRSVRVEMAGVIKVFDFNGMLFNPFEVDQEIFGYNKYNW